MRTVLLAAAAALLTVALAGGARHDDARAETREGLLVGGARVFDGVRLVAGNAVLVRGGRLARGGPADLFVVRGNPLRSLDALEDVALVLVGGAAPGA